MNPTDNALVLSVDEKIQIQALDRTGRHTAERDVIVRKDTLNDD